MGMSLIRLAKKFALKLAVVQKSTLDRIKEVYQAALNLTQPNIKKLWEAAVEADGSYAFLLDEPMENIRRDGQMYYWTASNNGLTRQQHAKYLSKLFEAIDELKELKTIKPLDPMATNKLQELEIKLRDVSPIEISAPVKKNLSEKSKDVFNQNEGAGLAYRDKGDEMDQNNPYSPFYYKKGPYSLEGQDPFGE